MAVGSLKEESHIEIHDIQTQVITAVLKHHTDMIDSLLRYDFPQKVTKTINNHITWLLSASRDRHIALWKLVDGKVMTKCEYPAVKLPDGGRQNRTVPQPRDPAAVNSSRRPFDSQKRQSKASGQSR